MRELQGYQILATDGEMGRVDDFYLTEEDWAVRYLVADAGNWLIGHRVLISPQVLMRPDWDSRRLPVSITREQVKESPTADTAPPVSHQKERERLRNHVWPYYWATSGPWSHGAHAGLPTPVGLPQGAATITKEADKVEAPETNYTLRSGRELIGYAVTTAEGRMGYVADFMVNDATWQIHSLVADTGSILPGEKVTIPIGNVDWVSWADREIRITMPTKPAHGPT